MAKDDVIIYTGYMKKQPKKKLEDVQKFACRLASYQWDASYQELLQLYELPSQEERI